MSFRKFAAFAALLAAPLVMPSTAQAQHPDFSGKWTYDAAASSSTMMGGPVSMTMTITQTDKSLKNEQSAKTPMGDQSATLTYALDGSPSKNTVDAQGTPLTLNSTAAWDGSTLVITTDAQIQGQTLKTVERWTLDAAGKVLTLNTDLSVAGQSMSQKRVFNKG